jgi:uncharacterized membrane protein YcgQ (UPF0703/DUF1980 family)
MGLWLCASRLFGSMRKSVLFQSNSEDAHPMLVMQSKSLLMLCAFVLSYVSTFVAFLIAILQRYSTFSDSFCVSVHTANWNTVTAYIVWSPLLNMCVLGRSSSLLTVSWASSLGFETLVLGVTCWNAVDRPREANTPLLRTLQKDGIIFFAVGLDVTFNSWFLTSYRS